MGIVVHFEHETVEGVRAGRFDLGPNTSAIVYRIGNTLIDTGPANRRAVVRAFAEKRRTDRMVLTHHHEDHSGNAAELSRDMGIPLMAPPESIPLMEKGFPLRLYQKIFWGRPSPAEAVGVPEMIEAGEGFRLVPIHTPGHSPDMTCYLEPDRRWLFTGDLLVSESPRYLRQDENLGHEMRSLEKLLAYDFETAFCSHRGIVPHARQAVSGKLDHLRTLRGKARALSQKGMSVSRITARLLGPEDRMTWVTMRHFSKKNLIEACLSSGPSGAEISGNAKQIRRP